MLARALSGAVLGIDAYMVTVEADVASGLPSFSTVGLPQGAVKEGKDRVVAAIQNSGFIVPPKRLTVNLAPAYATKAKGGGGVGANRYQLAPLVESVKDKFASHLSVF